MATRIQYLLEKGTAAGLDSVIEHLKNEAADTSSPLDGIDWENLHTDGDSQEKLLKALNPQFRIYGFDPYTVDDLRALGDVWTSLHDDTRTVGAAAGCWAVAVGAVAATKGKIAKKRKLFAELLVTVGCSIAERRIPEGSDGDSPDGDDAGDADDADSGDEPLSWRDVREARERFRQGYGTEQEYLDVYYGLQCQNGNESACDE